MKRAFTAVTAVLIIALVLLSGVVLTKDSSPKNVEPPQAYVGIAFCGNTVAEGKLLIDKVKGYTNLFVLQSGLLQRDLKSVDEIGDYAVSAGMYFLPYFGNFIQSSFSVWLENAKQKWGNHLLGVYYGDEPGGKMLDDYVEYKDVATGDSITKTKYGDIVVQKTSGVIINYELGGIIHLYEPAVENTSSDIDNEATFYSNGTINIVKAAPNGFSFKSYQELMNVRPFKDINETSKRFIGRDKSNLDFLNNSTKVFTSDYGLYWFDYLSGYDVVIGQVGWNLTLNQQIALMRGAATMQNKSWGIVITWKYQQPPYLDTGIEILNQMRTAYESGAKYLILFNYYDSGNATYGTMKDEHFHALESFWNNVINNPEEIQGSIKADSVLVLPKNYGWGGRWEEDKIWGIFKADEQTRQIWSLMQTTLKNHGLKADIVYDDSEFPIPTSYYNISYCFNVG